MAALPRRPSDLELEKTPGTSQWAAANRAAPQPAIQSRSQNRPDTWERDSTGNVKGKTTVTGTRTPAQTTLDMLRQGGWAVPSTYSGPKPKAKADEVKLEGEPTELVRYNYIITPEEWARIQAELEGRTGYTPPATPPTQQKSSDKGGLVHPQEPVIPRFNMEETQSQPLTYETYLKLTPDQKAGIDMNALFVNAREKDVKETNTPTEPQRVAYDKDVMRIFGPGRGSETFAPETVALVKQLGIDIPAMDLDEFLALDYTIGIDDLADFEIKGGAPLEEHYGAGSGGAGEAGIQNVYNQVRSEENQRLGLIEAVRQSRNAIDVAFSNLYNVRGDVVSTLSPERKADVTSYGGTEQTLPAQPGYPLAYPGGIEPTGLTDDERGKNLFYTNAYGLLADKTKAISDLWSLIETSPAAADQNELDALFAYFDQRTRQEAQYGRPRGFSGETNRSPEEIRQWLGLDK